MIKKEKKMFLKRNDIENDLFTTLVKLDLLMGEVVELHRLN